jgi:hypothetical protein
MSGRSGLVVSSSASICAPMAVALLLLGPIIAADEPTAPPRSGIFTRATVELGYPLGPAGGIATQYAWAADTAVKAPMMQAVGLEAAAGAYGGRMSLALGRAHSPHCGKFIPFSEAAGIVDTFCLSALRTWGDSDRWTSQLKPFKTYLGAETILIDDFLRLGFFARARTVARDDGSRPFFLSIAVQQGIRW